MTDRMTYYRIIPYNIPSDQELILQWNKCSDGLMLMEFIDRGNMFPNTLKHLAL